MYGASFQLLGGVATLASSFPAGATTSTMGASAVPAASSTESSSALASEGETAADFGFFALVATSERLLAVRFSETVDSALQDAQDC